MRMDWTEKEARRVPRRSGERRRPVLLKKRQPRRKQDMAIKDRAQL